MLRADLPGVRVCLCVILKPQQLGGLNFVCLLRRRKVHFTYVEPLNIYTYTYIHTRTCDVGAWCGVVFKATSRKVPGSIPCGVTGDFFRGIRQFHVLGIDSTS
jgi:hypothetical protein